MKSKMLIALACVSLIAAALSFAQASERHKSFCRADADRNDPMLWSEDFGVAKCNDRAATPYQPWDSAKPVPKDHDDPMTARDDWRVNGLSAYDHRYDDRYDRRSHRYR